MNRGDRREGIVVDAVDRQDFLKMLAEACQKTSWQVHAYCLNQSGQLPRESAEQRVNRVLA